MAVHEKQIEIRWRDIDAYRHVNNAVYATYLEECRDEFVERVLQGVGNPWDYVLARVAIDYRRELTQADDMVVQQMGNHPRGGRAFARALLEPRVLQKLGHRTHRLRAK